MTKWLLVGMLLFRLAVGAQQQNVSQIPDCSLGFCAGNGVPTFSCNPGQKYARVDTPGTNYTCTGSPAHWVQDAGSSGGSMVYPGGSGIPVVAGGASWGTTMAAPTGAIVGDSDTQTLSNKTANSLLLNADPTVALGAATKQYVDASGSGGVLYPGATNHAIPAAMITGGVTSLVDSAFFDDGLNTGDSESFKESGTLYLQPTGTATSGGNFASNPIQLLVSYWNSTAAVSTNWQIYASVASGTTGATTLNFLSPPESATDSILFAVNPSQVATSGANIDSPKIKLGGAVWNSTASQPLLWTIQGTNGTGANPTTTLLIGASGTTGVQNVSVPSITATAGTPGIGNNGAAWTAGAGAPSSSCAVSSIYSNTSASSASTALYVCYPANTWNAVTIP